MNVAKIFVSKNRANVLYLEPITSGTIGATVSFEFDETWDGFRKTYVFRAGSKTKDDTKTTGVIPTELLVPNIRLEVGVYGTKGEIAIPTIWADLGVIRAGADPSGDESTDPSLPVWAQLQQGFETLRENIGAMSTDVTNPNRHAEYFTITDDGVISLKPEYRGICPPNRASAFPLAVSDNGANANGSKIAELPKYIVVPEIVNETAVVSLAPGMFMRNEAIEEIVIPYFITAIPDRFCDSCFYLRQLHGTENIETVGQVCFQQSRIEKAVFPKLTSLGMGSFYRCPFLVYADLGNITRIENLTFTYDSMLSRIKGGAGITFVGQQAFTKNYRLHNVDFLPNLKSIGFEAFHRCRLKYDWKSLADNGCAFPDEQKNNGDSLPYNGKNTPWHFQGKPTSLWWENCTITPCENPVTTLLSQTDPRWMHKAINSTGRTYETGCSWMTVMHIYCALHNLTLSTVEEFEAICNSINPEIIEMFTDGTLETAVTILQALGLETSLAPASQERLQTMYNALNSGSYAVADLYKDSISNMGHAAMIYGVNANKELLIADSNVPADENVNAGEHTIKYPMPIENAALLSGDKVSRILIVSLPTG